MAMGRKWGLFETDARDALIERIHDMALSLPPECFEGHVIGIGGPKNCAKSLWCDEIKNALLGASAIQALKITMWNDPEHRNLERWEGTHVKTGQPLKIIFANMIHYNCEGPELENLGAFLGQDEPFKQTDIALAPELRANLYLLTNPEQFPWNLNVNIYPSPARDPRLNWWRETRLSIPTPCLQTSPEFHRFLDRSSALDPEIP